MPKATKKTSSTEAEAEEIIEIEDEEEVEMGTLLQPQPNRGQISHPEAK